MPFVPFKALTRKFCNGIKTVSAALLPAVPTMPLTTTLYVPALASAVVAMV